MAQQQLSTSATSSYGTLWDRADTLRRGEFDTAARLATIKALVRIAVHEQPLRSATQCRQVKSVGSEMIKVLETARGPTTTETGKYASAAVAILAALLETEKTTIPTPMRDVLGRSIKAAREQPPLRTFTTNLRGAGVVLGVGAAEDPGGRPETCQETATVAVRGRLRLRAHGRRQGRRAATSEGAARE